MSIDIARIYPNELKRERVRNEIKEQEEYYADIEHDRRKDDRYQEHSDDN